MSKPPPPPQPRPATSEVSAVLDLSDLVQELDDFNKDEKPPQLVDRPATLWGFSSGMYSDVLTLTSPTDADGWSRLAEEYAEESVGQKDPELRALLACEAGRVLFDRLGRMEDGELLMRNSGSPVAEVLLGLSRESFDSLAEQLQSLEARATDESLADDARVADWVEYGMLCETKAGDLERALEAYDAALAIDPRDTVALALACDAATGLGNAERARKLIEDRIANTEDPRVAVGLWLDLADLTTDPSERRRALEKAHETDPTEETALRRLIRVIAESGDRQGLMALYRKLAQISEDPYSVSTALHLAFLNAVETGDDPSTLVAELSELALEPGQHSGELLAPLIEVALHLEQSIVSGRDAHLTRDLKLLERVAGALDAPRERAVMRLQMARVQLEDLRRALPTSKQGGELPDPLRDRAQQVTSDLEFCLEHLPHDHWIFETLAELYELLGRVDRLAVHLQSWARTHAAGPGRAQVLGRLGRVHEDLRRDLPRAAEMYELALAEDPDDPRALRALGRVYEKMHRWPQAVANLQRQANQANDVPERLRALRRVAVMAQHELRDHDLAVNILQQIIRLDPDDLLSGFQLAAIAREGGRANVVVETLRALLERLADEVSRTALLVELGEVLELRLKQREEARAAYEEALRMSPGYGPALRALARIYRDEGDLEALLRMHETTVDSVTDPAVLALKAARICQDELGDIDRAIEYLWRAYKADPDLVPARELLLQMLSSAGRIREAYDLLRAQDEPKTQALLADRHYHLGLMAEALARQSEDPEQKREHANDALQHHRTAMKLQPEHGLAYERCRRLLIAYNDRDNLAELLRSRADQLPGKERAVLLVQLARVLSAQAENKDDARQALEAAAEADPGDSLVRRELETLLRRDRDTESLPSVYLAASRASEDPHFKATMLVEAAELLLRSERPEDFSLAGDSILEALRVDPGNPYAVRHLESLLADPNADLNAREAVAARAVRAQSDAERAVFYLESAELLERASAFGQARRAYEAALGAIPELLPAELGVARVLNRRDEARASQAAAPAGAAASLHVLMAEARDAAARAGSSGDPADGEHALSILRNVFARYPNHRDAVALTRSLAQTLPDPAPAVALLTSTFDRIEDRRQRYDLGLLLAEQSPDPQSQLRFLQAAHDARPEGREALRRLVDCYRTLGLDDQASTSIEQLLGLYDSSDPTALELRLDHATYLARDDATIDRALEHAERVLAQRPDDARAIDLMADLLARKGENEAACELLERLIAKERDRAILHALHLRRAHLLSFVDGQDDAAIGAVRNALDINPGHRQTLKLFATLARKSGRIELVREELPNVRAALMGKIGRGAVSLRDLHTLRDLATEVSPELMTATHALLHALDPSEVEPPPGHLQGVGRDHLRSLLDNADRRARVLAAGEEVEIHELLTTVEGALPRLLGEFISLDPDDLVPVPASADVGSLAPVVRQWADVVGMAPPLPHGAAAHNACVLLPGDPPVLRVGANLWMQGELESWRGLAAVSLARKAMGAPLARSLVPIELDLLLAACFETVRVFNAITADPDPRRLGPLTAGLTRHLPRKQRKRVEELCQSLTSTDLLPGATARATATTDFRVALLMSGDVAGCLSAACLLDGVAGGTLKQRINRSSVAQSLVNWMLSDSYLEHRR